MKCIFFNQRKILNLVFIFMIFFIIQKELCFSQAIKVAGYDIKLSSKITNFDLKWEVSKVDNNLEILTFTVPTSGIISFNKGDIK